MDTKLKELLIGVEKNLRLATVKIRTDQFYAERYLQNALQTITDINSIADIYKDDTEYNEQIEIEARKLNGF